MKPSAVLIRHRCPPCSSTQSRSSLRTTYRVEARASRAFAASLPTPLQDLKKKKRGRKKTEPFRGFHRLYAPSLFVLPRLKFLCAQNAKWSRSHTRPSPRAGGLAARVKPRSLSSCWGSVGGVGKWGSSLSRSLFLPSPSPFNSVGGSEGEEKEKEGGGKPTLIAGGSPSVLCFACAMIDVAERGRIPWSSCCCRK